VLDLLDPLPDVVHNRILPLQVMAAAVANICGFRIAVTFGVVLDLVLAQVFHVVVLGRDYFIDERQFYGILSGFCAGREIFWTEQLLFCFLDLLSLDWLSVRSLEKGGVSLWTFLLISSIVNLLF
jgi:hypothetical protein